MPRVRRSGLVFALDSLDFCAMLLGQHGETTPELLVASIRGLLDGSQRVSRRGPLGLLRSFVGASFVQCTLTIAQDPEVKQ